MQVLASDAPLPIGALYILDDGSDVAILRLRGESADLWVVEEFIGDGTVRRRARARRRWQPRALIAIT